MTRQIAHLSDDEKRGLLARLLQKKVNSPKVAPLSFAQQRLWFLDQLQSNASLYNLPSAIRLTGHLDIPALERTLSEIVKRHETLRTTFTTVAGEPRQVIAPAQPTKLPITDISRSSAEAREGEARRIATDEAQRPFDLARGPLMRARLLRLSATEHVLLFTLSHIVADGWSLGVLAREVSVLYDAFVKGAGGAPSPLPELPIQYADFARWQRIRLTGDAIESQIAYWKRRLSGAPMLELPADRRRPAHPNFRGAKRSSHLSKELREKLNVLSQREGVTLYMMLLAAFQTLLMRYCRQTDISVGSPVANRTRAELEPLIGFFVNTLVLRVDLSGNPSFRQALRRAREACLDAYEHQDLPFEKLVEELQPERSLSHSPLFQVMFVLQNAPAQPLEFAGIRLESVAVDSVMSKFDLTLEVMEANEGLMCIAEYSAELFDERTIERLLERYGRLLKGIVAAPDARVWDIQILSEQERNQVLVEWSGRSCEEAYEERRLVHELFEAQAARTPDAVAVVCEDENMTYAELDRRANQVARHLRRHGVGPEVRVGLMLERSVGIVVGLLGVLKAGGAYVPLDPDYPRQRLAFMLEDAGVELILTQQNLCDGSPMYERKALRIDADWPLIAAEEAAPLASESAATNLAYVIYTSGSTGRPKGVLVEHAQITRLFAATRKLFRLGADDVWTLFHSYAFDFSVWEIWGALLFGARLIVVRRPVTQSPEEFYQLLSAHGVTVLNQTPSAFRQLTLVEETEAAGRQPLSLRQVIFGGEALEMASLRGWFARHGDRRPQMVNMYGITETTVHVTHRALGESDVEYGARSLIGRPLPDLQLYVLDPQLEPAPIGAPGEIYVGGAGVTRGYLGRPELTTERFAPDPFSASEGARLYRTGDLARYLANGELEYLGRIDHQVKIRGYRIELGEIEAALALHEAVHEAVVIANDEHGDKRLIAYVIERAGQKSQPHELRNYLRERLPDYMVPAAFVTLDVMPLTPSGKLDRHALPAIEESSSGAEKEAVEPRTPAEELLANIWREVLRLDRVDIGDNFFDLGGHSLLATQVISRVRDVFKVEIPLRRLFETPILSELAGAIEESKRGKAKTLAPPLAPTQRNGALPLSFAQERLWFLDQLVPNNPFYNMPVAFRLRGSLRVEILEQVFTEIVRRHETLRTTFKTIEGRPAQEIEPAAPFKLGVTDLSGLASGELEAEAKRQAAEEAATPFDLTRGPLMRARLLRLGPTEHILLFTMHHIIADGWSLGVLAREVAALYEAFLRGDRSPLAELPIQYADYAVWQRKYLAGEALDAQLRYWKERLGDEFPPLNLPTDKPRPVNQSFRGATGFLPLPATLVMEIKALCQRRGVTLYMLLLAAFTSLLLRYTGQDNIIIGSPIANRTRAETEGLIGFFVNTLALRTDLSGDPSFRELLQRVRAVALEAYGRQDMPFELLVEHLKPERDLNRNPLFQVMFQLENTPKETWRLPELELIPFEVERATTQFDLSLDIIEGPEGFIALAEYSTDLFDRRAIDRLLGHFQVLLEDITRNPDRRVTELQILTREERRRLLEQWNETGADVHAGARVHSLFSSLAERAPHTIALTRGAESLSYGELNRRANQLAHRLRAMGAGPETVVALCLERSVEMVVALLAVLKAGAAYLPLDPGLPGARLSFMLREAGARLLLTQEKLRANLPEIPAEMIDLDAERETIARQSAADPEADIDPDDLTYLVYTSGSTGAPKAAAVTHHALVNHNLAVGKRYRLRPGDKILHFASVSFDVAAEEIFPTLLSGAAITLDGDPSHDADAITGLRRLVERERVTVLNLPASFWREWTRQMPLEHQAAPPSLRLVVIGSEKVPSEWLAAWRELNGADRIELINAYGTSETTITSTLYPIPPDLGDEAGRSLPIGRPIANTQTHLLDNRLQPVPVGIPGELYIGGAGLARGYCGRAELTAERFVPHPFGAKPGARLYKTGDVARYLIDGDIEFIGRLDQQIKLRGYRIELGEIEKTLAQHEAVREIVALAYEDAPGDTRLAAYVTQEPSGGWSQRQSTTLQAEAEQLSQWQAVHDNELFNRMDPALDPTFNISGWNSSYTGLPIPADEMREWVEDAVKGILELRPRRAIEIGCGTGLILFRAAPHCEEYIGTDFSRAALDYTRRQLEARQEAFAHVKVTEKMADDFGSWGEGAFDTVILNSVIQYFPSAEYLMRVLEGAIKVVGDEGHIFIGDVRSLPLLEAFHTSVELHRAGPSLTVSELRERVRQRVEAEEELVVDPALFTALRGHFPRVSRVEIKPKRARYRNELTLFRYQVVIHVGVNGGGANGADDQSRRPEQRFEPKNLDEYTNRPLREKFNRRLTAELKAFARERLPEYMVPTTIMLLGKLPLTPSGKIDLQALRAADRRQDATTGEFVAPGDELEGQLSRIWEEVLDTRPIGVMDGFFDLGGHSLLAVRLFALVEQRLNRKLPLSTIFEGPTVKHMAEVLRRQEPVRSSRSPLVEIQPRGDKRPFFCVHPAGGNVLCYAALSRHLGDKQPFFGLQARGLDGAEEAHTNIVDMAADYVRALRAVQPEGPYLIGGWSMGGIVAFEMAQRLRAQGQRVALLALIDSAPPDGNEGQIEESEAELWLGFAQDLGLALNDLAVGWKKFMRLGSEDQFAQALQMAKEGAVVPKEIGRAEFRRMFESFKTNVRAMRRYAPRPYQGPVSLLWAKAWGEKTLRDFSASWRMLVSGSVEVYEVTGDHYSIMRAPHVAPLAEQLKTCIETAGND